MSGRFEGTARAQIERISPYLRANLGWERAKRRGNAEMRLVDSIVHTGMVAADIGASAGDFTARLAHRVGRSGVVHSFEPHPTHRDRLERIAKHRQIQFHPVALSDREGRAGLHVPVIRGRPRYGLATLRPVAEGTSVEVLLERLDGVLAGIRRLDFVKCDVEGHEQAVLKGGEQTLRRLMPTLLVEIEERHLASGGMAPILGLLEQWGYSAEALFPDGLRPIEEFNVETDQLAYVRPGQDSMPRGYVNTFLFTPRRS